MTNSVLPVDMGSIEFCEGQYLAARVRALSALAGNPYGASVRELGELSGCKVMATKSPMLNRVCGDAMKSPDHFAALARWFANDGRDVAVPLVSARKPGGEALQVGECRLTKMRGWTHAQMAASVDELKAIKPGVQIDELDVAKLGSFLDIHAAAFHTPPEEREMSLASFVGLYESGRAGFFVAQIDGRVAGAALVYFATNGMAYLGTAATAKAFRGQGCHAALIAARIAAARRFGCHGVAATALMNSQSRRNLERFGLGFSHVQTLYAAAQD